ncbi:MAG: hypothetical protein ACT4P1_11640 [Sporichthyaceae bacterium]
MGDLTGHGKTLLPTAFVTAQAEYGWATTIDAARGAATDVGIVLAAAPRRRRH